jgi:hypothetical protein
LLGLTIETIDTGTPFARLARRNGLSLEVLFAIEDANIITRTFLLWALLGY